MLNDVPFIFWVTNYARDGHFMNMWLGPQEREYVRVLRDFLDRLDKDVVSKPVTVSLPDKIIKILQHCHMGMPTTHYD